MEVNWKHLQLPAALTHKNSADASKPILGDVLCLAGAALYAVSNVGQEYAGTN